MDKPPFPAYLDNSAISDYKRCPTLWQYGSLHKLTRAGKSVHLHAGACFATGLEATRRGFHEFGLSEEQALILGMHAVVVSYGDFEPEDRHVVKSCERIVFGLLEYFIQYGLGEDQLHPFQFSPDSFGIEFNFALPLPIENPSTGEPLLYTGRFDQLATYNGTLYGEDDKTAMQLGPSWAKQWELDAQFTGYSWAAREYGYSLAGFFVRGLSFLTSGYGHAQTIVYRADWQIERWLDSTLEVIQRMIEDYSRDSYISVLDKSVCASYSGCKFHALCASQFPSRWLAQYEHNPWNPMERDSLNHQALIATLFPKASHVHP